MTGEAAGIVAGCLLAAALVVAMIPRRSWRAHYDARREVWTFHTSAGRFKATLGHADHKGRCYIVTARYRDGRSVVGYCAPAEQILHRYIERLTAIYHQERVA